MKQPAGTAAKGMSAGALSTGWYVFLVTAGPLIALLLAIMIDLLHINLLRLAGVPLPRLPFDPY